MKTKTDVRVLDNISGKISLFETNGEVDEFLKEAVSLLMDHAGAALGAVFIYEEDTEELVFRVGFDKGDFWDSFRCGGKDAPTRFALDGNEVGKAFTEGSVRRLSYPELNDTHPFRSKILIPIIRGPEKIGVFVMANQEEDAFAHLDHTALMREVSLLGDKLAVAMVLVSNAPPVNIQELPHSTRIIKGKRASSGAAEGKALPIWADMDSAEAYLMPQGSPAEEERLFDEALKQAIEQLDDFQEAASEGESEMVALIFTAQLYMLKDESFTDKMRALIQEGSPAAKAVREVVNEYADRFSSMTEVRLAEKAQDVRDLGFRLITNIGHPPEKGFSYEGRIVLSRHMYPSDLYRLALQGVAGLVLRGTNVTAHISILARSLQLPVLITDDKSLLTIPEGAPLLLDAEGSKLYIHPDEHTREAILKQRTIDDEVKTLYTLKGKTADGVAVSVMANINILKDAREAVHQGAEGIGLYRSEFPLILKNDFLSEEQQYKIYRSIVESQVEKPVVLRTADIGGDKLLQGRSESESNPFLGVRGIRFSLANREMFRDQLKAMLRAGYGADLGILFPMVSDVDEVLQAKEEIELCLQQLSRRGVQHNSRPRIGAMVELPSAAMAVGELASETDFLSIGTNDLVMYLLAVDRTNEQLSHLYRSHHPTVLRVLATIAEEAGDKRGELSVCGDVAADPALIPFFVGLGIRKLSVGPSSVEAVKQQIGNFSLRDAEDIAREMLSIRRVPEMEEYMKAFEERETASAHQR